MATKELTQGNPLKLILLFAFPIFLGNVFQQFYNLVDALIVGRYIGIEALGAVGATGPLIFLLISFIFASTQGFSVVLAQNFGARNYDMVRKSLCTAFVLAGILTVILTLISVPLTRTALVALKTPSDILDMSTTYLFIMFAGIFATVFYNVSSNTIRAVGDSKTPLYFLIFASFLNIFLDILFITKFKMGIAGAGYATVLSQGISTVLCLSYMFFKFPILRPKKSDWKLDKDFVYEHLRIGIPMGFQMSVLTLGMIALQYVLNGFGTSAVAGFTTAMRIDQTFCQAYLALGATMATFSAQNFGAGKLSRIKEGAKNASAIVVIVSIIAILTLTFYARPLTLIFMSQPDEVVIGYAVEYLHITMMFYIFIGFLFVFRHTLQGMGSVIVPLLSGFVELIARGCCAFILGYSFGYTGLCYATPAAWISGALVLFIGYRINLKKNAKRNKLSA